MEHVRLLEGDYTMTPDGGDPFPVHVGFEGLEIVWNGIGYVWDNELKRYESVLPPPSYVWIYDTWKYLEMVTPSGPSTLGTYART